MKASQQEAGAVAAAVIPPPVGTPWPEQGGVYAGVMRGSDSSLYHLVVAMDPQGDVAGLEWGEYGKSAPGAESDWDGLANTQALAAAPGRYPAAERMATLELGGFTDWYLPAQREMSLLRATVTDLFEKEWYWSSTQCGRYLAWCQSFAIGGQNNLDKGSELRARAVRRLPL